MGISGKVVLYIFYIISLLNFCFCSRALRNYKQNCGTKSQCDSSKFLVCVDEVCRCQNPTSMIYSHDANSCLTKADEPCYLEETWTQKATDEYGQLTLTKMTIDVKTRCVKKAVCSPEKKRCVCKESLVPDENGVCKAPSFSRKATLQITRSCKEGKCPPDTGLRCIGGICKCGVEHFKYFNGSKCLSRVDGPCETKADCTPFSDCIVKDKDSNGRCKCLKGYVENNDGRCDAGLGQPCNFQDMPCTVIGGLTCVDGKCQCPDELQQYLDDKKTCVGMAGAFCREKADCVDNAMCNLKSKACTCERGYKEVKQRKCVQ